MSTAVRLSWAGLVRTPGRTLTRAAVLAAAVALLGGMLVFVGNSLRTMTASAVRAVPLDWQGPVGSYAQARQVAARLARQRGIEQASATATAPLAGAQLHGPGGSTTATGAGAILAVPPDYLAHIRTFRLLHGRLAAGGVVLDQQMAATLRARIGDRVSLETRRGTRPRALRVTGVALVSQPDVLFQPLDPRLGPAPAQPPANVAVMPTSTFARTFAGSLRAIAPGSAGASSVPGGLNGVQWQVQAQVDRRTLVGSPGHAGQLADRARNRAERSLPGQVQFVDNLSSALTTAAEDALYAEALYIMLAVPGALVALGLAYLAALGTAERDRRQLALLRARGASRRDLIALALSESVLIGIPAGLVGAAAAYAAVSLLVAGGASLTAGRALLTAVACVAVAVGGAAAARLAATSGVLRTTVVEARRSAQRSSRPLWQRLYLDVGALALSGLIYWLTARTGFSAVVNPDSNPTLSLSIYMFFGPALLWIGATLLLVRLRGYALPWAWRRAGAGRPRRLSDFLLASAGRRGPAINRGLIVVGLLLAFGVSLGIFAATYDQQAKVDAQLSLGADVTATAPPGAAARHDLPAKVAAVPGVAAATALDHSYAYVGPDLQDTYGIEPSTFNRATTLRDSYFVGAGSREMLSRLRSRPDGILVSKETISDYSLRSGDLLKLRVLDRASGRFRVVPFHVVGIVQEFPSAPKDSFMVANLGYLAAADRGGGPNVVLARAAGDPAAVARRVAAATRPYGTIVNDIREQTAQTVSSITTVDLTGISRIEGAFAILLAAGAMALLVALAVAERRHELATMAALGAPPREIGAFIWSEAALVLAAGLALAAGLGWLLAKMLLAMLRHVFDPPPDHLAIPWTFLGALGGAALLACVAATAVAGRGLRRLPLGTILREQ